MPRPSPSYRDPSRAAPLGTSGVRCSRIRDECSPDVVEPGAVLTGVMSAEQELAAGAEHRQDLRFCAATVAAVLASEQGRHNQQEGRGHFVTPSSAARPDAESRAGPATARRRAWSRRLSGGAMVTFIVVPLPVLSTSGLVSPGVLRTIAECAAPPAGTIPVSLREHGGDPPFVDVEATPALCIAREVQHPHSAAAEVVDVALPAVRHNGEDLLRYRSGWSRSRRRSDAGRGHAQLAGTHGSH